MKTCKQCEADFEVTKNDLDFYNKMGVPEPVECFDCMRRLRLSFRNERVFYSRKCDMCKKDIISVYRSDSPLKVYCNKCWWSDDNDTSIYGRDYDFSRSFFEQIQELQRALHWETAFSLQPYLHYKLLILISFFSFVFNYRKIDVNALMIWIIFFIFSLSALRNIVFFAFAAYFVFLSNFQFSGGQSHTSYHFHQKNIHLLLF